MNFWKKIRDRFGVGFLVVVFCLALARVLTLQSHEAATHRKVIKMAHWQLESDVREALDEIGREYTKLHPDIEVQQILIGERGYGSWISTRLIGGTAPEMIEMGMIDGVLRDQLFLRYFQPLSDEILKPNPYNKGTSLEGAPWKDTYYDGMRGGFVDNLLEYYQVPASGFTVRLFYNKRLFKEATGLDEPPGDFRKFIAACEQIKAYGRKINQTLIPIAGSGKYNAEILFGRFEQAVNSTLLEKTDLNRDGDSNAVECGVALVGGDVDFQDPRIKAMLKGREYYMHEFQPAFASADRMDSAFLFIQQKALMIASGAWDASSYIKQANFEIGVCDFPLPSKDDPEFGRFVEGPAAEEMRGGFAFSLNRYSPHPQEALDFLKFLSSQTMNERLNRRTKWIPMIRGNKPDSFIAHFWPHLDGVKAGLILGCDPRNTMVLAELMNLFSSGKIDAQEAMERFRGTFVANMDLYMNIDLPRELQIESSQDELRKNIMGAFQRLEGGKDHKEIVILEGQLSHEFNNAEMFQRYAEARARTKLPR